LPNDQSNALRLPDNAEVFPDDYLWGTRHHERCAGTPPARQHQKALMKEQGVASVTVRYEKKELVVSFDDAKTTPDAIMKSTAAVGFSSQIAR
jgi:hypothetical protein